MLDLTGQKFGKLTAIKFAFRRKGHTYWLCKCDCGTKKSLETSGFKSGNVVSCGCVQKANARKLGLSAKIHGMSGYFEKGIKPHRFYNIWQNMKKRCYNQSHKQFKDYGGRGITVCQKWHKFINFYNDMYLSYKEHYKRYGEINTTIDRINNDKNYCKFNCKWSTRKEQQNNRTI